MIALAVRRPREGPSRTFSIRSLTAAAVRIARSSAGIAGAFALVAFAPLAIPDLRAETGFGAPTAVGMQYSTLMAVGFALVSISAVALGDRLHGGRREFARLAAVLLAIQALVTGLAWAVVPAERLVTLVTSSAFALVAAALLALVHRGRVSLAFAVSTVGFVASVVLPVDVQVGLVGRLVALAIATGFAVAALVLRESAD
jgi:hypothetical protein